MVAAVSAEEAVEMAAVLMREEVPAEGRVALVVGRLARAVGLLHDDSARSDGAFCDTVVRKRAEALGVIRGALVVGIVAAKREAAVSDATEAVAKRLLRIVGRRVLVRKVVE